MTRRGGAAWHRYHTAVVAPLTPDGARLAAIRDALPAVGAGIYLNAAAAGPLPAETARVMAEEAERETRLGRAHPADAVETLERVAEARAAVAAVLGADLEAVALTRGTGHGLELACACLPWRPGDRAALLTDGSEPGAWPIMLLRGLGVEVDELELDVVDADEDRLLALVASASERGARLIGLPHVVETTGVMLPLSRICRLAHAAGAIVAVDGSQSVGAVPLAAPDLGADLVAFPSERWLLGPAGLGGIWCSQRVRDRIRVLHPAGFADPSDPSRRVRATDADPAAGRVDGQLGLPPWHRPSVVGFARSCGLLSMQIGLSWAWQRAAMLARHAAAELGRIDGVEVLTPADRMTTLVSFRIQGWSAGAALDELGARIFAIAGLAGPIDAIRISPGAWNTEQEIDRFVQGVDLLAAHTPATVPPRRTLSMLQ
jgi:selenocysteine lyase/cysteine desulfurase